MSAALRSSDMRPAARAKVVWRAPDHLNYGNRPDAPNRHVFDPRDCQALWCAVLVEQVRVASHRGPTSEIGVHAIEAARNWFGTKDYFEVCALAGIDGAAVLEHLGVGRCDWWRR